MTILSFIASVIRQRHFLGMLVKNPQKHQWAAAQNAFKRKSAAGWKKKKNILALWLSASAIILVNHLYTATYIYVLRWASERSEEKGKAETSHCSYNHWIWLTKGKWTVHFTSEVALCKEASLRVSESSNHVQTNEFFFIFLAPDVPKYPVPKIRYFRWL